MKRMSRLLYQPLPALTSELPKSTVIPLISQVWNGVEPQNCVSCFRHTCLPLERPFSQNLQAQFHIGTGTVPFLLHIDTGSSLMWFKAQLSSSEVALEDQSIYMPSVSSTYKEPRADRERPINGDNTSIDASLCSDTVTIGAISIPEQLLGAVDTANLPAIMKGSTPSGLIGLSFHSSPLQPGPKTSNPRPNQACLRHPRRPTQGPPRSKQQSTQRPTCRPARLDRWSAAA
jgi:hypothetical protein